MDEHLVAQHADLERVHWWFVGRAAIVTDIVDRHVVPGNEPLRLLDIGCGAGVMLPVLGALGHVTAVDASEEAVRLCRARYPDADVRVGLVPDDLPPARSADAALALDVLEHIDDDRSAAAAILDVLVAGGVLICTVPAFMALWSGHDELNGHRRRYRRRQLVQVLESAGFEVQWSSYFNTILFPLAAAVRLGGRLRRRQAPASDFDRDVGALNGVLARVFASERRLLRRWSLPFGVSVVAVARRPATSVR